MNKRVEQRFAGLEVPVEAAACNAEGAGENCDLNRVDAAVDQQAKGRVDLIVAREADLSVLCLGGGHRRLRTGLHGCIQGCIVVVNRRRDSNGICAA
ncbi:hypothetical protein ACSQ76_19515 [Roseovarius sp. B08]|uniref:hypothetical protein n=1 Tax=Roseovarius sp. B08 TaxID=3449223 RepID=UPI003EDC1686